MCEITSILRKTISNWMPKIIDGGCWPLLIDFCDTSGNRRWQLLLKLFLIGVFLVANRILSTPPGHVLVVQVTPILQPQYEIFPVS